MILFGKSIHDLSDIWVHDYHDTYGVHYGFDNVKHYEVEGGVLVEKTSTDKHEDYYFNLTATGDIDKSSGITFGAAQSNYKTSDFYNSSDHEHPIIAVFRGNEYIWPSREVKDATGIHSRYVFVDYADDKRTAIQGASRSKNIPAAGSNFNIYLDTHQTFNLYKCMYQFKTVNWVSVANTDPKQERQVVLYNDSNNNAFIHGFVNWDFDRDDVHNKLINVPLSSTDKVDSIINIKIEPNKIPFERSTTVTLFDQTDQYRGMLTQQPSIVYNITQKADTIDFTNSSIIFYENDNTNAERTTSYGPMSWIGGTGWIYFKIEGTSALGAKRIFGEYDNQNSSRVIVSGTYVTCGTPRFNPGTGIWTVPVTWPTNNGGSSTFSGSISIEEPEVADYKQDSITVLKVSGITSSAGSSGNVRTDNISVSISAAQANDPTNLKYLGTPSSTVQYSQNGGSGDGAAVVTYSYKIDDTVDYATVTGDGVVIWDANNTGAERSVTVTVTCVQTGDYKTVVCKQASTGISYDPSDGATITFYNTNEVGARVVSSYGPMSGDGGDGWIYFKIVGKNGNGKEYVMDDPSKLTVTSSNGTLCAVDKDSIDISSTTGIFKCKLTMLANPGSRDYVSGTLTATASIATYENCAYSVIIPSGLTVKNDGSVGAKVRTFTINVAMTDGVSGDTTYTQSPGKAGHSISTISYTYKFGGNFDTYMCDDKAGITETTENKFYWKENKSTQMRGGSADIVTVTVICNDPDENGNYSKEATVYPQQNYNTALDVPQDDVLQSIKWTAIEFYEDSTYAKVKTTVALDSTTPHTGSKFSFSGGTQTFYYKIKGSATYQTYDEQKHEYGTRTDNVYFGTSAVYNGSSANLTYNETVPDDIKKMSGYSATHTASGEYLTTTVSAPALNAKTDERTMYKLSIKVTAVSTNQQAYWPASATFCKTGSVLTIDQAAYNPSTTTYQSELVWNSIKFSRYATMTSAKYNDAAFTILYDTSIDAMYCQIYGSYNTYIVTDGVRGELAESVTVQFTDAMFGDDKTTNVSVKTQSGTTIKFASIEKTDTAGVFKINVTGANTDNTTGSDITSKMTLTINKADVIKYNGVQSEQKTFTNCLTITKSKSDDVEGSETEWEYVKFYDSSENLLPVTDTVYSTTISGSATSYTVRFSVHGTKYKTINGVRQTPGTEVTADISQNYFKLSSTNAFGTTSSNTADGLTGTIYSKSLGTPNTSTSNHTALTVSIIYQGLTGDKTLTNTLKVTQGAAPADVCTLAFRVNSTTDDAYTQLYEPNNLKTIGATSSSKLYTSTSGYAKAMTIYIWSYNTSTVDGVSTKYESIPSCNNATIDTTDTAHLYKFSTTANNSSSNDSYDITNSCGKSLTLVVRGYSQTTTYETVWEDVIFGPSLGTDSSNQIGTFGSSSVTDTIDSDDSSYSITFKVRGTRKEYLDSIYQNGSDSTVYYEGSLSLSADGNDAGLKFTDATLTSSTLYEGVFTASPTVTQNLSDTADTGSRHCGFNITIAAGSNSKFGSWGTSEFKTTDGIFKLIQTGEIWGPVITW